jgi:hypothetical protein
MRKIDSLREVLASSIEDLAKSRDRLRIWIDRGSVQSRQTATFGLQMSYRVNVLLMDMTTDFAVVAYTLCAWLRIHQPDLLAPGKDAFALDFEVLDSGRYDALVQIDITQGVTVFRDTDGNTRVEYLPEPDDLFAEDHPFGGLDSVPVLRSVQVVGEGQIAPINPAA